MLFLSEIPNFWARLHYLACFPSAIRSFSATHGWRIHTWSLVYKCQRLDLQKLIENPNAGGSQKDLQELSTPQAVHEPQHISDETLQINGYIWKV